MDQRLILCLNVGVFYNLPYVYRLIKIDFLDYPDLFWCSLFLFEKLKGVMHLSSELSYIISMSQKEVRT